MKLVSFQKDGREGYGVLTDSGIVAADDTFVAKWPTLLAALKGQGLAELGGLAQRGGAPLAAEDVTLLPPITEPGKIICIGLNYRSHIAEMNREMPKYPMLFTRYPDSIVGHGEPMLRPIVSEQFDYEGELAVVIGRTAHHVKAAQALDYVAGYACFNDGSIRDYQRQTSQFVQGKTFWRSGSFGPALVTADEVGDLQKLHLSTRLNGKSVQEAEISDLCFDVPTLIEFISTIAPLQPGDVIATGTTGGVGAAHKPPLWMKPGDRIEVEITGLGLLANPIEDEKR